MKKYAITNKQTGEQEFGYAKSTKYLRSLYKCTGYNYEIQEVK